MNRKQTIFLLGLITGAVFGIFIFFLGTVMYRFSPDTVDVLSRVEQALDTATPNVVGVVNIKETKDTGMGSGVIYRLTDNHAYIVTNYHVVKGSDEIEVAFQDEVRVKATLIGEDMLTDLAIIKIDRGGINQVMAFSDSSQLHKGEFVLAIGNPLGLDFYGSATLGIVSSSLRLVPVDVDKNGEDDFIASVIQTDAAINPGNSGGALVNLDGKLIGINSMKIAGSQIEGIGFSIPTLVVNKVIKDLEQYQKVIRPYLGMQIKSVKNLSTDEKAKLNITDLKEGIYVNDVSTYSCSYLAGIKKQDIITEVEGQVIKDVTDFRFKLYEFDIGEVITLSVKRGQETIDIEVELKTKGNKD